MAGRIQIRRGTAAEGADYNPILADGEPAYETDTCVIKIGDGVTEWLELPVIGSVLVSPDGTVYRIVVDNAGVLSTEEVS